VALVAIGLPLGGPSEPGGILLTAMIPGTSRDLDYIVDSCDGHSLMNLVIAFGKVTKPNASVLAEEPAVAQCRDSKNSPWAPRGILPKLRNKPRWV
jgi:hypothetical protein